MANLNRCHAIPCPEARGEVYRSASLGHPPPVRVEELKKRYSADFGYEYFIQSSDEFKRLPQSKIAKHREACRQYEEDVKNGSCKEYIRVLWACVRYANGSIPAITGVFSKQSNSKKELINDKPTRVILENYQEIFAFLSEKRPTPSSSKEPQTIESLKPPDESQGRWVHVNEAVEIFKKAKIEKEGDKAKFPNEGSLADYRTGGKKATDPTTGWVYGIDKYGRCWRQQKPPNGPTEYFIILRKPPALLGDSQSLTIPGIMKVP